MSYPLTVIDNMNVFLYRARVLSVLFFTGLGAICGNVEKSLEEVKREIDTANISNESLVLKIGSSLNKESIDIGRAVHEYKYRESEDALILLSEHVRPDTDSVYTATVLDQIKMTSDTLNLLLEYASSSDSSNRSIAFQRLARAPLILEIDYEMQNRIKKIFERYINNHDRSNLKLRVQASIANQDYLRNLKTSQPSPQGPDQLPIDLSKRSDYVSGSTTPTIASTKTSGAIKAVKEVSASEPDVEQTSNWWLWLIGAVVAVGGVAFALFRKS